MLDLPKHGKKIGESDLTQSSSSCYSRCWYSGSLSCLFSQIRAVLEKCRLLQQMRARHHENPDQHSLIPSLNRIGSWMDKIPRYRQGRLSRKLPLLERKLATPSTSSSGEPASSCGDGLFQNISSTDFCSFLLTFGVISPLLPARPQQLLPCSPPKWQPPSYRSGSVYPAPFNIILQKP